ncbi:hypothetical protein L484_003307 [Morus notabilis]|uniref:Small ribosomal subunit protein mS29 n=1 Tax=Morus notabilis TaxID=981085 RepID=W9QX62_9ROSA|nr:hypothetical protein L484_003307 [Morus notabilis]
MLRSIVRGAAVRGSPPWWRLSPTANYAKTPRGTKKEIKRTKSKGKDADADAVPASDIDAALFEEGARARRLALDENDPSLDVRPNGRPLFTSTPSLSQLTPADTGKYFKFKIEELNDVLPEGLPAGMVKEFEESLRTALLVRQSFLDLRDNFRRVVDPPLSFPNSKDVKVKKQIVLDGPVSCGKSIALAMLVHWARDEVLAMPFCLCVISIHIQDFQKFNEARLQQLPCQLSDPIPLGEGAGVGWIKDGSISMALPEGSTLYDLINIGIKHTYAAVGVVVRLRKELSLVKDVPVLIAIDQYNNWFTFSKYEEAVTVHSTRPIHARELSTVNAFRSMMHDDMMVGAFSHSTAVGKLRHQLPDVPIDARVNLHRYTLEEAEAVSYYYLRQRLASRDAFSDEGWKKMYYLSNGNGSELRFLMPFMQWRLEDTPYADSPYARKK